MKFSLLPCGLKYTPFFFYYCVLCCMHTNLDDFDSELILCVGLQVVDHAVEVRGVEVLVARVVGVVGRGVAHHVVSVVGDELVLGESGVSPVHHYSGGGEHDGHQPYRGDQGTQGLGGQHLLCAY